MSENKMSPARTLCFVVVPFVAIPAAFLDFIPAPFLVSKWSILCFALIGICFCVWLAVAKFFPELHDGKRTYSIGGFFKGPVIAVLFLGLVYGWLFWLIFAKEFGWLVTSESGDVFSEVVEMRTNNDRPTGKYSALKCKFKLQGGPMVLPNQLCIQEGDYNDFPDQVVSVRIKGKKSWMGKTVSRFYIENKKVP